MRGTRLALAYSADLSPDRHSFSCVNGASVGAVFDAADMRGLRGRPAWRGPPAAPETFIPGLATAVDERALILSLHNVGLVVRSSKGAGASGGSIADSAAQELVLPKRVEVVADMQRLIIGFSGRGRARQATTDAPTSRDRIQRNRLLFSSAVVSLCVDTVSPTLFDTVSASSTTPSSTGIRAPSCSTAFMHPDVRANGWVDLSGFDIRLDAVGVESAATFGAVWSAALPGRGSRDVRYGHANATGAAGAVGVSRVSSVDVLRPPQPELQEVPNRDSDSFESCGGKEQEAVEIPASAAAVASTGDLLPRRRRLELKLRVHALPGKCTIDSKTAEWARADHDPDASGSKGATKGTWSVENNWEPALLCVPLPDLAVTARIYMMLPAPSAAVAYSPQDRYFTLPDNVVAVRVEMPVGKNGSPAEVCSFF